MKWRSLFLRKSLKMFSINQLGKIYQLIQVRSLSFAFCSWEKRKGLAYSIHPLKKLPWHKSPLKKITFMKSEHLDRPISWHEVSISRYVTLTRYLHDTSLGSVPAVYFDHDGAILIAWCEGLSLLRNVNTHPVEDHGWDRESPNDIYLTRPRLTWNQIIRLLSFCNLYL